MLTTVKEVLKFSMLHNLKPQFVNMINTLIIICMMSLTIRIKI